MGTSITRLYDTTSILRFITKRFNLPILAGLAERDAALKAHGEPPLGDLDRSVANSQCDFARPDEVSGPS